MTIATGARLGAYEIVALVCSEGVLLTSRLF